MARNRTATSRIAPIAGASVIGALDGYAASRDLNAGRGWNTTGIGTTGAPVLAWGWTPAVQIGSLGIGIGALASGQAWGRTPLCMGAGLLARSFALTIAQRGKPTKIQGYHAVALHVAAKGVQLVRGPLGGQDRPTAVG